MKKITFKIYKAATEDFSNLTLYNIAFGIVLAQLIPFKEFAFENFKTVFQNIESHHHDLLRWEVFLYSPLEFVKLASLFLLLVMLPVLAWLFIGTVAK
jgi:hypothetical protein